MSLHFGMTDDFGSEHTIDGHHFVGEVRERESFILLKNLLSIPFPILKLQIFGFNGDLYDNFTIASNSPHGLVAISVMIQTGQLSNVELRKITESANNIKFGGNHWIKDFTRDLQDFFDFFRSIHSSWYNSPATTFAQYRWLHDL